MNVLTLERLRLPADTSRTIRHWGGREPWQAADVIRRDIVGRGVTLPIVWLANGPVAVIVSWNVPVLRTRMASGQGPVLYRSVLHERLMTGRDLLVPAALRVEAFVGLAPLRSARRSLSLLAGLGQVIATVPHGERVAEWDVFECDYRGFTVAEVGDDAASISVRGRTAGRSAGRPVGHQQRLIEEQLFDVALRTGAMPAL